MGALNAEGLEQNAVQQRLLDLLAYLGLSQEELARRLRHMGARTGSSLVSLWVTGGRQISFYSLAAVSLMHDEPRRCLQWLVHGGPMPIALSFPKAAAKLGLTLPELPIAPLGEDAREMHQAIAQCLEFTLRANEIDYGTARDLVRALIKMAEALEDQNCDATHMWQAISFIKVRSAEKLREKDSLRVTPIRRERQPGPDDPPPEMTPPQRPPSPETLRAEFEARKWYKKGEKKDDEPKE